MKIKVILLANVAKLWNKWDIVEVSDAYARNVLFRENKAKVADKSTIKAWERKQQKKKEEELQLKQKIDKAIADIKENWLKLVVSASVDWHLYEKVDIRHIEDAFVSNYGFRPKDKEIDFPQKKVSKIWEYDFSYIVDGKKVPLKLKVLTK